MKSLCVDLINDKLMVVLKQIFVETIAFVEEVEQMLFQEYVNL